MKKKINHFLSCAVIAALISALLIAVIIFHRMYREQVISDMSQQAVFLEHLFSSESELQKHLQECPDNLRLTIIQKDGSVLYDTLADHSRMENHRNRQEIQEALEAGTGYAVRNSDTIGKDMYYYAIRLQDGNILRLSKEEASIWSFFNRTVLGILLVSIPMLAVCMAFSRYLTSSLLRPIEEMAQNIDQAVENNPYEELTPFVKTIRQQHEDIMKSANMRQEFTANVSHELKTPLTAISGYAELIRSGITSEKENIRFAGEIHNNAQRLLTLINDIIRLSELDSFQSDQIFEDLDLAKIAEEGVKLLQIKAAANQIHLQMHGSKAIVHANREMMNELVYNLCDNAIRYNKLGGSVDVTVEKEGDHVCLTVQDNGIGIPKESQERIFERFYRVDKSRSKATGGTGLGLAIVKHIVLQHRAQVSVDSEVGIGTRIKVTF